MRTEWLCLVGALIGMIGCGSVGSVEPSTGGGTGGASMGSGTGTNGSSSGPAFPTQEDAEAHCFAAATLQACQSATEDIFEEWGACVWSQETPVQWVDGTCELGSTTGRCTYDGYFNEGCFGEAIVCDGLRQVYADVGAGTLVEGYFCQWPDNYPSELWGCHSSPNNEPPDACMCACEIPPLPE